MALFKKEKSLNEMEEDTERLESEDKRLDAELSISQKRVAIAKLRERGLKPKHFNFDFKKIIKFLKSH
ncbi:hypothetical protein LCGC14_0341270 [marine sediment metagenome]|uniref:Uncharacterized protein n=1 Tax=marine sediment metagenome TaxID=412755 RepID=A0A0F9TDM9_9ZZZZ